jgi:hypothetical protein
LAETPRASSAARSGLDVVLGVRSKEASEIDR